MTAWADSLEAGCASCHAPDDACDCLVCANCGELLATEGRFDYARVTPATVCCSTTCLLALASWKALRTCAERPAWVDPTRGEHPLHGAPVPSAREGRRTLVDMPLLPACANRSTTTPNRHRTEDTMQPTNETQTSRSNREVYILGAMELGVPRGDAEARWRVIANLSKGVRDGRLSLAGALAGLGASCSPEERRRETARMAIEMERRTGKRGVSA